MNSVRIHELNVLRYIFNVIRWSRGNVNTVKWEINNWKVYYVNIEMCVIDFTYIV